MEVISVGVVFLKIPSTTAKKDIVLFVEQLDVRLIRVLTNSKRETPPSSREIFFDDGNRFRKVLYRGL
jgi:hypothetical protein